MSVTKLYLIPKLRKGVNCIAILRVTSNNP